MDTKSALFKNVRVPARLIMLAIVLAVVGCFWKPTLLLSAAVGTFLLAVVLIFRVVMKDLGAAPA